MPVEITVFEDRAFTFILKTPPTPVLLRQKAGLEKGSMTPGKDVVGSVTEARSKRSPRSRCPTSTPTTSRPPSEQVRGTARSMGLKVV